MGRGIRSRLILSYMLVALICVVLISALSNYLLDGKFKNYIINNIKNKSQNIQSSLGNSLRSNGNYKLDVVENIGIDALQNGLIIKVLDSKGKVVWDARMHNNGMCESMLLHLSENMTSRYPNWKGNLIENAYPITNNHIVIGQVLIGYYGPYYYSDNDLFFLNELNTIFMAVGIFSLLLAFVIGILMAGNISKPILKVIDTARFISKGHYGEKSNIKSSIREINQLTDTINELSESLENQDKLRKRLTADVAHELRTPITTLQSHLEAIADGVWEPSKERIESCIEETVRLGKITFDLEKLTSYESEKLKLDISEFDISRLIKTALVNFESEFMAKKIEINFTENEVLLEADRDKISQVIVNLLSNAMKYTQESGAVWIKAERLHDAVRLEIKDNGIGIADKDLKHIFERFYRADESRCRATGGSGIGLTITKAIIDAHKGRIDVESQQGNGTSFIVTLPILQKHV